MAAAAAATSACMSFQLMYARKHLKASMILCIHGLQPPLTLTLTVWTADSQCSAEQTTAEACLPLDLALSKQSRPLLDVQTGGRALLEPASLPQPSLPPHRRPVMVRV